jgi:hypothetical protein
MRMHLVLYDIDCDNAILMQLRSAHALYTVLIIGGFLVSFSIFGMLSENRALPRKLRKESRHGTAFAVSSVTNSTVV